MKAKCGTCGDYFTLSAEEENLRETGNLPEPICDDCFEESEMNGNEIAEYMSYSDADPGL